MRMLGVGDFVVNNTVVFEYKTIDDFIQSIFNESLFDEVFNQTMVYDYSYLIICGSLNKEMAKAYYSNPKIRDRYPTMQKYKGWVNKIYGGAIRRCRTVCNVIEVPTEKGAFYEILSQSEKCLDHKTYGGVVRKKKDRTTPPVMSFLTGIHGIGETTAKQIVKEFDISCLMDLLRVSGDDLVKHGFRRDKVSNFVKHVYNEEYFDN